MILADSVVRTLCQRGQLISEGFNEHRLHGCTYEFAVGRIAYRYDYENRVSRQEKKDDHIIYPFETLTVITQEKVNVDDRHYLSLFAKGFLFSLGVVPVCTAADPGFSGHLGITLTNLSARPIVLPVGTQFVKGVFHELNERAERPYIGGHGDATMSWPYPSQFQAENFDIAEYSEHLRRFLPAPFATAILVTGSVSRYLKWTMGTLLIVGGGNLASYFLSLAKPAGWTSGLLSLLNIVGAIASVLGLVVSLYALRATQKTAGS